MVAGGDDDDDDDDDDDGGGGGGGDDDVLIFGDSILRKRDSPKCFLRGFCMSEGVNHRRVLLSPKTSSCSLSFKR